MHRNGVVDAGADPGIVEGGEHAVPFQDPDDVEVPDVDVAFGRAGSTTPGMSREHLRVAGGGGSPSFVPAASRRSLESSTTAWMVSSREFMPIASCSYLSGAAVGAEKRGHGALSRRHPSGPLRRHRQRRGSCPDRNWFRLRAERAGEAPVPGRALGLRGILYDHGAAAVGSGIELLDQSDLPEQVHRHDRLCRPVTASRPHGSMSR